MRSITISLAAAEVLLLALAGCGTVNPRVATTPNHAAELRGDLPQNPMNWKVITTELDKRQGTMSTLFGNDAAVFYARTHADSNYPPGAEIAMVSWNQQEDSRWFGARIPATPRMVEFVTVTKGADQKALYAYRAYEGSPLTLAHSEDTATPHDRAAYLLAERAAVMP